MLNEDIEQIRVLIEGLVERDELDLIYKMLLLTTLDRIKTDV